MSFYCIRSTTSCFFFFFFFNDTATTEIYTLSLHDALPISPAPPRTDWDGYNLAKKLILDRKSTRLNSSHTVISYAVFCLKKKKEILLKFFSSPSITYLVAVINPPLLT